MTIIFFIYKEGPRDDTHLIFTQEESPVPSKPCGAEETIGHLIVG